MDHPSFDPVALDDFGGRRNLCLPSIEVSGRRGSLASQGFETALDAAFLSKEVI